jgi:branched-chain amino acid transport system substrate-binding protein
MKLWLAITCAAVVAGMTAIPAHAANSPIKVGTIFPLSGGTGPQGKDVTNAIKAMAAIINDNGGVLGRKLKIIARDDESTPAVGVSRAQDLISKGASVILEGWDSPVTLAEQPVISRAGITDITVVSKADQILSGKGNPLPVRFNSSNKEDGVILAKYIAHSGKKKIAFMTENDAYGNGAQKAIEAQLKKMGYHYDTVDVEKFPFKQSDFRVQISSVKAANPQITVMIDANEGLGFPALMRQAHKSRLPGTIVSAVGTIAPSVIKLAGPAANGVIGADIYFPQIEPFKSYPANQAFVKRMQKMFDTMPDKYMALGAEALQVWAKAANDVKSLKKKKVAKRIRGGSFKDTVFGDVSFKSNGQMKSKAYLFVVKHQKIKLLHSNK